MNEEKRDAARHTFAMAGNPNVAPLSPEEHLAFNTGFDAGYAAASRWVSIAENGLPSEAGKYAWWAHDESDHHHWNGLWYDPATFDEQDREAMSRTYTHYQKIEPPKENK